VTSGSGMLLCYSDFSLTNADQLYVWKEPQTLWNRRELRIWCIDFFSCFMGLLGYEHAILR